jgi:hypothetical protein
VITRHGCVARSDSRTLQCAARVLVATFALALFALPASSQQASVWIDVNAAHSRPPSGAAVDAANYGLVGARLRLEGRRSAFDVGATHGRGAVDGSGGWLTGRAAFDASRVSGRTDFGIRADGTALTYLSPVHFDGDKEYTQSFGAGTVRPFAGVSMGGFRIGAEGMLTRGVWRSELSTALSGSEPGVPLPGLPQQPGGRHTLSDDGDIVIAGAAASLLRVFGPATAELRGISYSVRNPVEDGRYNGIDAVVMAALGPLDLSLAGRHRNTPTYGTETGGHVGVGIALGTAAYLHAAAGRSVSDPLYGTAGGIGVSAGISVRLGRRALGPPAPVSVGEASGRGRLVHFTLAKSDARSVAVAGDFRNWEERSLQRGADGVWRLETVIEPGVYHYAFVVDGTTWMVPGSANGIVDDGFGRKNATLIVNSADRVAS